MSRRLRLVIVVQVKESFATVPGDGFPGTVVASVLPSQQSSGAVTGAYTVLDVTFPPYQFDSVKWPISSGFLLAQQPFSSDSSAGSQREAFVRELGGEGGPIFGGVSFAARVPEQVLTCQHAIRRRQKGHPLTMCLLCRTSLAAPMQRVCGW